MRIIYALLLVSFAVFVLAAPKRRKESTPTPSEESEKEASEEQLEEEELTTTLRPKDVRRLNKPPAKKIAEDELDEQLVKRADEATIEEDKRRHRVVLLGEERWEDVMKSNAVSRKVEPKEPRRDEKREQEKPQTVKVEPPTKRKEVPVVVAADEDLKRNHRPQTKRKESHAVVNAEEEEDVKRGEEIELEEAEAEEKLVKRKKGHVVVEAEEDPELIKREDEVEVVPAAVEKKVALLAEEVEEDKPTKRNEKKVVILAAEEEKKAKKTSTTKPKIVLLAGEAARFAAQIAKRNQKKTAIVAAEEEPRKGSKRNEKVKVQASESFAEEEPRKKNARNEKKTINEADEVEEDHTEKRKEPTVSDVEKVKKPVKNLKKENKMAAELKKGLFVVLDKRPIKLSKVTINEDEVHLEGEDVFKGKKVQKTMEKGAMVMVLNNVIKQYRLVSIKDKKATLISMDDVETKINIPFANEALRAKVLAAKQIGRPLTISLLTLREDFLSEN